MVFVFARRLSCWDWCYVCHDFGYEVGKDRSIAKRGGGVRKVVEGSYNGEFLGSWFP